MTMKVLENLRLYILAVAIGCATALPISSVAADFITTSHLANKGDAAAQFNLGVMYYKGDGVRQDYAKAHTWFLKAVSQGHSNAQSNLGAMFYQGNGVQQDYARAFEWYTKAANQGNAGAQSALGIMYDTAKGMRQDYEDKSKSISSREKHHDGSVGRHSAERFQPTQAFR